MFKTVYATILAAAVLAAALMFSMDHEEARARGKFQYCLGAAQPASAEAIKACHEAAWPKDPPAKSANQEV